MSNKVEIKDFFGFWKRIHKSVLHLALLLEQNDLDFTFDPRLGSVGSTFLHIGGALNGWLGVELQDNYNTVIEIDKNNFTLDQLQEYLKQTFERLDVFLNNCKLEDWTKHYTGSDSNGPYDYTLEWILWHLVEHEIHHRTQLRLQLRSLNKNINDEIFWEATTYGRW